ncbi:hypothetical protein COJ45_06910 [Bacillus cereus]|nr:hypothetical protein COJ45_06910 [Bacillus cereus]
MIKLFKPDETDFTHNGIGILSDAVHEAVVEEDLNGVYVLSFKYPLFSPHGLDIIGQSLIQVPTPDGEQLFRVANPSPSMGILTVFCYHIFYDLIDNFIEDTNIVDKTGLGAVTQIKGGLQYPSRFQFFSDITKVNNARLVRMNPVEALLDTGKNNSFITRWGGELKRDNFNVNFLENRGRNRGVVIQHKKDLLGYEASVDWQSPITKIMPQGFDGLILPEKYVVSPNINKYVNPKIQKINFEDVKAAIGDYADDEDAIPLEDAYALLRQKAKAMFDVDKVDQPIASYKVSFQELTQTEEYKDYAVLQTVYMGDTVTVQHDEDNIFIQAKVINYKYDPVREQYIEILLGNFKNSFASKTNKIDKIQDDILNVSFDISTGLSDADARIKEVKEGLETTNGNLDTTNGNLNNANGKINDLETGLDQTNSDLNTTNGKVNDLEGGLNDANGRIDGVITDMNELGPNILQQAKDDATSLINSGFGSYVRVYPDRVLIMDTNSEMTAKKVWQWNVNGLGYSSTGINGPYGTAITKDGSIVADFVTTGKLNAGMVTTGFNEYSNNIMMLPDGLQSQVNGKKRMELNNLGQLMIYDDTANFIGSLGYQFRVSDNSKGATINIGQNRFLALSVYNPTTDLFEPRFEVVDTATTYGFKGIFAWRDVWLNTAQLIFSDANSGSKANLIQELLFADTNKRRLSLISDVDKGIDFCLKDATNGNVSYAGLNDKALFSRKKISALGGIVFNNNEDLSTLGIYKTVDQNLIINTSRETRLTHATDGNLSIVFSVTGKNQMDAYGNLDMHGWYISNASYSYALSNPNAETASFTRFSAPVESEREMNAVMNSSETFTHIGKSATVEGKAMIDLPDYFKNETDDYHVFISKYGRGDIWVSERTLTNFTVESENDIEFSYEIKITKPEETLSTYGLMRSAKRSIFDRKVVYNESEEGTPEEQEIVQSEVIVDEN